MTKRDIIYSIFEKLKLYTDDSDFSEEFIASLIDNKRAMLLKQQFGSNPWKMPIEVKQELCVDLEVTEKVNGVACFGKILRTTLALPASIKIKGKEGPLNIRKADRQEIAINLVPIERFPFIGSNPHTSMMLYAAIDYDGKLYLASNKTSHLFLESIKVTDIYENPDDAQALMCNADTSVEPWDAEYPLEASMADPLINIILQELLISLQIPSDDINDAEDGRDKLGRYGGRTRR